MPNDSKINLPGSDIEPDQTERGKEREKEDEQFIPVIVKRTDEARRHPDDILEYAVAEGVEQLRRPSFSLFLSAVAAGLILSFTAMAVAVIVSAFSPGTPAIVEKLAVAFVYPFGFVVCIMSGTQLFTEHTATAVYPILDKKDSVRALGRLWVLVITGNLVGATIGAVLLSLADPVIGAHAGYVSIGEHLVSFDVLPLFISSLLAGWLMALGAWLTLATPPTISQIASIYLVTFLIGIGGLHHSIAGAVEIFTAVLVSDIFSISSVFKFIVIALLGNLVGGSLFVAVLNYGHIRKTQTL